MDYLDLRDLAEELNTLENEAVKEPDDVDRDRLRALRHLEKQLSTGSLEEYDEYANSAAVLIPEEDFKDYAQEFAYDVGYAERADNNPLHAFMDWESWADSLKMDYTEVTFDGDSYLIRTY